MKSKQEILDEFLQDPYPQHLFEPLSFEQMQSIHKVLLRELNIPLDRLGAQIARTFRTPLVEYVIALKTHTSQITSVANLISDIVFNIVMGDYIHTIKNSKDLRDYVDKIIPEEIKRIELQEPEECDATKLIKE